MSAETKLSLSMVLLKSENSERVTVYFSQFPEVIVDADTEKEASMLLIATLNDYLNCDICHYIDPEISPKQLTTKVIDFNCVGA
jgi:hypothetical protein